ncbi:MAG: YfcC family protein, partial [Bosea sp.]|nr:YfcC family protein [Bosea sp. (in: a-proteobacteria)]
FYARRCRARNIETTMTQEQRAVSEKAAASQAAMSGAQWLALGLAAASLVVFIIGTLRWKWGEPEMTAMFLIIAIGGGLICRMGPSEIADEFLRGSGKLVPGAFIVGLARAISIVLADGKILDPIVNTLSSFLEPLSPMVAAVGMFVSAAAMHVAISSGSGESAALIPIFAPLGDALHLTRQVTVQSVLLGEGIMNCINPTSGVLMAVLATSGIAYGRWVRFVLPLVGAWFVISVASLIVGVWIHWGPL